MNNGWKEKDENIHILDIPNLRAIVHRKQHHDKRWFLTVDLPPLRFKDWPLTPIDLDQAKDKAINIMMAKSQGVHKNLQNYLKNDSKRIDSFRLRLIAILDKTEKLQSQFDVNEASFEPLIDTIKLALSDLD